MRYKKQDLDLYDEIKHMFLFAGIPSIYLGPQFVIILREFYKLWPQNYSINISLNMIHRISLRIFYNVDYI